jgi:hypothetical protein
MTYHNPRYAKYVSDQIIDRMAPAPRRRPRSFIPPGAAAAFLIAVSGSVFAFVAFALHVTFAALAH